MTFSDAGSSRIRGCRFYWRRDVVHIGGRGSSSGVSDKEKPYGSEYSTVHYVGNIKFVTANEGATKAPDETMTKGRVYATIDKNTGKVKYITYYDKTMKKYKQIDLEGPSHIIDGKPVIPHTHLGNDHKGDNSRKPDVKEQKMINRVRKAWDDFNKKRRK